MSDMSIATQINTYDPYHYRDSDSATLSYFEATINVINSAFNTGLFAMPLAFQHTGWLNGWISAIIIGIIYVYSTQLMLSDMYTVCKMQRKPKLTFEETMKCALELGPNCLRFLSNFSIIVDYFSFVFYFGSSSVCLSFIAGNIKQVVDAHFEFQLDIRIYIWMLLLPSILIFSIQQFKYLAPLSFISNAFLLIACAFICVDMAINLPKISTIVPFQNIRLYPFFFGTYLFSIANGEVYIAIEEEMKYPEDFLGLTGVFSVAMAFVVFIHGLFGFIGYWHFGDDALDVITTNLKETNTLHQVCKIMFAVAIFLTYPLQCTVTIEILWNRYIKKKADLAKRDVLEFCLRWLVALLTVLFAILIPVVGPMMSFLGCLCLSFSSLIFIAILNICVRYHEGYGQYYIYFIQDILLIAFGFGVLILGTLAVGKVIVDTTISNI